jgi:hypothetical protein
MCVTGWCRAKHCGIQGVGALRRLFFYARVHKGKTGASISQVDSTRVLAN